MADRLRAGYGAAPWHLIMVTAATVLAGWVALRVAGEATAGRMLLWFLGAVIAHDLVLFPVYAAVDRVLRRLVRGRVALLNHLRVPALGSALLFLVYSPASSVWARPPTSQPPARTSGPTWPTGYS